MDINFFWTEVARRVTYKDERWGQAVYNTLRINAVDTTCLQGHWLDPWEIGDRATMTAWCHAYLVINEDNEIVKLALPD